MAAMNMSVYLLNVIASGYHMSRPNFTHGGSAFGFELCKSANDRCLGLNSYFHSLIQSSSSQSISL